MICGAIVPLGRGTLGDLIYGIAVTSDLKRKIFQEPNHEIEHPDPDIEPVP